MGYGTGAIMAVPAHDERDHEFAPEVPSEKSLRSCSRRKARRDGDASTGAASPARALRSTPVFLDGLPTAEAKAKMIDWLEEKGAGKRRVQYKLRDWLFSRQRYWGEPFPIVWHGDEHEPLSESDLPLTPARAGRLQAQRRREDAPLGQGHRLAQPAGRPRARDQHHAAVGRLVLVLPALLRSARTPNALIDPAVEKYWMGDRGVDLYIGGAEHAVLHLLYARFWHKVLFDLGVVSTSEPFHKLVNQGMILGEDHRKMSKSWGNVSIRTT